VAGRGASYRIATTFDSSQTRAIAITRPEGLVSLPRRDSRLKADDTVYVVGPYRELLATLRKGQPPQESDIDGKRLPA